MNKQIGMRALAATIAGVVFLVAIILVRTLNYGGAPDSKSFLVDLPEPPAISSETAARHLAEAVRFRTITLRRGDPPAGQAGPWLGFHRWLKKTYPNAHKKMKLEKVAKYTLLYTWQGSDRSLKPILLMAHQDVVPVNKGTEQNWTGPPFAGKIIDGYVYGRGTIDNKQGVVGLMEAADALAASGFKPKRTIYLMFGHDEEVGGSGAEAGVALLKSRGVELEMVMDEGSVGLDPSPLTGSLMSFIGIAEKGYLTIELTALDRGGHSSTPLPDNAVVRLSRALVALDENQMPGDLSKPPVSDLFELSAANMSFFARMGFANMWLFGPLVKSQMAKVRVANAMMRTTTAATMLTGSTKENVLAQRATATVNFRIHPNDSEADVMSHIKEVTKDIPGLEIREARGGIRGTGASKVSPTDNRVYKVLASVAHQMTGGAPVAPTLVLGATDSRYASALSDNVYRFTPIILTPEELTAFHGTNERLSVENMGRVSRGFAQIMLALGGVK